MPTYEEVLSLAKRLSLIDQARLREALSASLPEMIDVIGTDETISVEELSESETALQEYWAGRDLGITSADLKRRLFGGPLG